MNRPFPLAVLTAVGTSTPLETVNNDLYSTNGKSVVQCTVTGSGNGATTAILEGSLDGEGWVPLATFSITASNGSAVSDGVYIDFLWFFLRIRATQVPTGSKVTVTIFREE